jgi:hypothetical protein
MPIDPRSNINDVKTMSWSVKVTMKKRKIIYTVELGYNIMKGTEYFVSL